MKRLILLLSCICLATLLFADRPLHRPQTIAESFLRSMQIRDFATAATCVLPTQRDQFSLIVNWSDLAGWFAAASIPSDFQVLRSSRTEQEMKIDYDVDGRGTAHLQVLKLDGDWYVDLSATRFQPLGQDGQNPAIQPANSNRNPRDRAKLFLDALARADFAQAALVGTPRTAAVLKLIASFAPYGERKAAPAQGVEILDESIDDNNASVRYSGGDGTERSVDLIKVGPDWMVDLSAEQLQF